MFESITGWATIVSAICAVVGLPYLFIQRQRRKKTHNLITGGSRNIQIGGTGNTKNIIESGDDNEQRG
ncbi:hypothetical protein GCM10010520_44490 [Rhizobium viscosum]|uniref:LPXTG cell wall anchor domain-containing protein n=1 Tax=Rhizobium viscosum TaxID=1673 RepID=A0ABR9INN6_RHIVS|nr:hypothetical protein [Rhizobium viscosum]